MVTIKAFVLIFIWTSITSSIGTMTKMNSVATSIAVINWKRRYYKLSVMHKYM